MLVLDVCAWGAVCHPCTRNCICATMPSALATQLAQNVSLNAPLLSETARKKHFASSSYLFSSSTKGQIDDIDTIHSLSLNALSQLKQVYPSLAAFDEQSLVFRVLFSHRAKETDRTLLTKGGLTEINATVKSWLSALGPCLRKIRQEEFWNGLFDVSA